MRKKGDGYIHLPSRRLMEKTNDTTKCVVRLTKEAYNELIDVTNETQASVRQVASAIILGAIENDMIRFDRDDGAWDD